MKIAICIGKSSLGGVSTSTYILAREMLKSGHKAEILVTNGQTGPDYDRARQEGWPISAICRGERWLRHRLTITAECLADYDVVINNHSTETKLTLPALPAHILRLSVIRSTNPPIIEEAVEQSQYLDALIAISPEVHHLLNNKNIKTKCYMIPNAVTATCSTWPQIKIPLKLVFLGRLTDIDKNILLLPAIVQSCKMKGLDCTLTIAGDGRDKMKLLQKIDSLQLQNDIKLIGPIPRDKVGDFFGNSHIAIFPSYYEGFGLTLVEAMAVGCVPVVSDIPSYRWILGKDSKALSAPTRDAESFARCIQTLINSPQQYQVFQKRLQKRQRAKFTPESTNASYLQLIQKLHTSHIPTSFIPTHTKALPLPKYDKLRCSRVWWLLQKIKDCTYSHR